MHVLQLQHLQLDDPNIGCLDSNVSCESKLSCLSAQSSPSTGTTFGDQ